MSGKRIVLAATLALTIAALGPGVVRGAKIEQCKVPLEGQECQFHIGRFAKLSGDQVVGQPGAPDGKGWAAFARTGRTKLCFTLIAAGTDGPTGAALHEGQSGSNGPVVLKLFAPRTGVGAVARCLKGVPAAKLKAIFADSSRYYVEVTSTSNPDGAMRGQLFTK